MSGQTKIVGTHRRVVLTGVTREPAWSELSGKKLTYLRYAKATSGTFVVYAYGEKLRESAWKKLFAGAETVTPVTDFDDCERYRRLRDEGRLKTFGEPTSKDVAREEIKSNASHQKRKVDDEANSVSEVDCKAIMLCKQVEKAKADLLYFPARFRLTQSMDALLALLRVTAEKGTWAEAAGDLTRLTEKHHFFRLEWLAHKHEYESMHKEYMDLKLKMWQARVDEQVTQERAKTEWTNIKKQYPLADRDRWDSEDADKIRPCLRQYEESKKRKRWLRDWLDDHDKARRDEEEFIAHGKAEYKRLRRLMQRNGVPDRVPEHMHMPLPVSVQMPET